jgi:hypothetical protein
MRERKFRQLAETEIQASDGCSALEDFWWTDEERFKRNGLLSHGVECANDDFWTNSRNIPWRESDDGWFGLAGLSCHEDTSEKVGWVSRAFVHEGNVFSEWSIVGWLGEVENGMRKSLESENKCGVE